MKDLLRLNIFLALLLLGHSVSAKQIQVCEGCEISTIKGAIELAENGDEILVKSGVYKEHEVILIDKSLKLIGEGHPVIDGENKETILKIKAKNFSIEGFRIINVGQSFTKDFAGILVSESENFTIKNNILENVFFGILIEKSKKGLIENNHVSGIRINEADSGNGIHAWHSSDLTITNNTVNSLRDGIYFEFVSGSKISDNYSHNNIRYGLHFMFSNNNDYFRNVFKENGAGVAVMFSKFINMKNNEFRNNWGTASYGLLLKEINDSEIEDNIFDNNTIAINIEGTNRVNYTNNVFSSNGWALKIRGACYANIFTGNNFTSNAFDLAYDSKLNDNNFDKNYWSEYTGYDLDKDGIGDIPYRPVKLFSYIVNQTPETIVVLRSLFVDIINFSEKVSPVFTPDDLQDNFPLMKRP